MAISDLTTQSASDLLNIDGEFSADELVARQWVREIDKTGPKWADFLPVWSGLQAFHIHVQGRGDAILSFWTRGQKGA